MAPEVIGRSCLIELCIRAAPLVVPDSDRAELQKWGSVLGEESWSDVAGADRVTRRWRGPSCRDRTAVVGVAPDGDQLAGPTSNPTEVLADRVGIGQERLALGHVSECRPSCGVAREIRPRESRLVLSLARTLLRRVSEISR